MSVVR